MGIRGGNGKTHPETKYSTGSALHLLLQNSSNFGEDQGYYYFFIKKKISFLAAHIICLGPSVKNLSLPGKDKLTFFLYNLMECNSLRSNNLGRAHYNSLARHKRDQQHVHFGLFCFAII